MPTNLWKRSIALGELTNGGSGKDGIPALANPKFETMSSAERRLDAREPVIVVLINNETRVLGLTPVPEQFDMEGQMIVGGGYAAMLDTFGIR